MANASKPVAAKGKKNGNADAACDEDTFDEFPDQNGEGGMGKKIFKYGVPFNLLMALLIGVTQYNRKDPAAAVTVLTEDSFNAFIKAHPEGALVDFYSPGCIHCEQLAPEFEKAGKALKDRKAGEDGEGGPAMLASVDGEAQAALAKKYDMKRYPTVLWFKKGENVQELPPMSRTAEKITEFVNWVQQPAVVPFQSRKEFNEAVPELRGSIEESAPPVIAGFAGQGREGLFEALEHSAEMFRGKAIFLYVDEGEDAEALASTASAPLRRYGQSAESDEAFIGTEINNEQVHQWVEKLVNNHKEAVKAAKAQEPEKTE